MKHGPRAASRPTLARATLSALCLLATWSPSFALADTISRAADAELSASFPQRLAITVVGDERLLGTFQQRVSSWFSDGTQVVVTVSSDVNQKQLLASSPDEVRAWIVPLSTGNALLSVSCVSPPAAPRHLVREVRLHSGFDELGLERLASVIHSAFVALRQGVDGVAREQAERELGAAGVAVGSFAPGSDTLRDTRRGEPTTETAPAVSEAAPAASASPAPAPPAVAPAFANSSPSGADIPAAKSATALLVAAGYGVRLRGAEGLGHGPSLTFGLQIPGSRTAYDFQLSAQYLLSSDFEAAPFSASVQTTALRVQIGVEPQLKSSLFGQVLLGLGADIANISARASPSEGNTFVTPHASGTQVRSMGELSLGLIHHGAVLDVGLVAQAMFSFQEVRYSATTSDGDAILLEPWSVQPALLLQGRFRNAL